MLNVCFLHLQASASLVPATPNPPRSGLVKARLLRVAGCFSVEPSLAEYFLQLQLQLQLLCPNHPTLTTHTLSLNFWRNVIQRAGNSLPQKSTRVHKGKLHNGRAEARGLHDTHLLHSMFKSPHSHTVPPYRIPY